MNPLEQRVIKLEKNLRTYRITFCGLIITCMTFMLLSSARKVNVPDVIKAKAFEVVDDNGSVLVELNKEKNNGHVSTFTPEGKRLVSLFTSDGGAGALNTFDLSGKVLFKVTRTKEGGGYMALFNSAEKEIAELGVTTGETGYFNLNDRNGEKIIWLTYTDGGGGYFSLLNKGTETVRFSTPDAGGRMGIYNKGNTRIGYMGAQDNQDGNITIWNSGGTRTGGVPN